MTSYELPPFTSTIVFLHGMFRRDLDGQVNMIWHRMPLYDLDPLHSRPLLHSAHHDLLLVPVSFLAAILGYPDNVVLTYFHCRPAKNEKNPLEPPCGPATLRECQGPGACKHLASASPSPDLDQLGRLHGSCRDWFTGNSRAGLDWQYIYGFGFPSFRSLGYIEFKNHVPVGQFGSVEVRWKIRIMAEYRAIR